MLLEAFRIHPAKIKEAAEIEEFNANSFVIHPAYVKRPVEVDLSKYIGLSKIKGVADGWFVKSVNELVNMDNPCEPSLFIRTPKFNELVRNCDIYCN